MTAIAVAAAAVLASCGTDNGFTADDGFDGIEECSVDAAATRTAKSTADEPAAPYICHGNYDLADEVDSRAVVLLSAVPNLSKYRELVTFDDLAIVARNHDIQPPARNSSEEAQREYTISLFEANGGLRYAAFVVIGEHLMFDRQPISEERDPSNELDIAYVEILGMTGPWLSPSLNLVVIPPGDFPGVRDEHFKFANSDTERFAIGSRDSDQVDAAIEVVEGTGDSIYGEADFVDAVRALYGLGSVSGTISDSRLDSAEVVRLVSDDRNMKPTVVEAAVNSAPLLEPFNVAAVGGGVDELGERFTTIALVHENEQLARDNVKLLVERINGARMATTDWPKWPRLEAEPLEDGTVPWSEVIDRVEIDVSGRILLARLYGLVNAHALAPIPAFLGQSPVPGTLLVY